MLCLLLGQHGVRSGCQLVSPAGNFGAQSCQSQVTLTLTKPNQHSTASTRQKATVVDCLCETRVPAGQDGGARIACGCFHVRLQNSLMACRTTTASDPGVRWSETASRVAAVVVTTDEVEQWIRMTRISLRVHARPLTYQCSFSCHQTGIL